MLEIVQTFFGAHPSLSFVMMGYRENAASLDLCPYGATARFLDAGVEHGWVARYLAANQARFTGPLSLPGWVLADLYLMPAAIGMLVDGDEIVAAYYAAPSIESGVVVGVSLIALREGLGAGAMVKALTLKALKARAQRGVTQWGSKSLRVHTRFGRLRVKGPAPSAHGLAAESFVYEVDLRDEDALAHAMRRRGEIAPPDDAKVMSVEAGPSLAARAAKGDDVWIEPPGLTREGSLVVVMKEQPSTGF